ncbi:15271_t:CDS:2 [Acaulospora morrowiae]|uniref:15271_t:CDS:1 n=1 Tax=Acaulospora morrowiae TaxID=94023 RepID=A0A9N8V061_9GLOM|nr:15271_t:CDS:2 [Acaulospora morrowiae]
MAGGTAYYVIAVCGKMLTLNLLPSIKSQLALATFSTLGLGIFAARKWQARKSSPLTTPPINSSSPEEEAFIQEFIKIAEEDEKKHH